MRVKTLLKFQDLQHVLEKKKYLNKLKMEYNPVQKVFDIEDLRRIILSKLVYAKYKDERIF
jgi:hypothetical protein